MECFLNLIRVEVPSERALEGAGSLGLFLLAFVEPGSVVIAEEVIPVGVSLDGFLVIDLELESSLDFLDDRSGLLLGLGVDEGLVDVVHEDVLGVVLELVH